MRADTQIPGIKLHLPGLKAQLTVLLDDPITKYYGAIDPELRVLDESGRWVVEPGEHQLLVGPSSRDIRLRGPVKVR